jgi:pSer/pThr/pTyr-binding forkhead associated (FHA) protein
MPGLRHSTPEGDKTFPLRDNVTIGRDAQNDLALPDDSKVSQQHARIRQEGDTYVVEDLQSTNGTFLERESEETRITAPQPLRPNDVIRVGSTRLAFEPDASPPTSEPEGLGETRVGRWLPEFLRPPEEFAPSPQSEESASSPEESTQRIAELEQQLAELRAQQAKKQGEGEG